MKLDKYQSEAVYTNNRNSLVVAAPGSGKTTVIINRVFHLIKDKNISYKNIIVITFTKAAALSMKRRYKSMITNNKNINYSYIPFFGTFHGLFYKILKNHHNNINIIDSNVTYRIITNVLRNYLDEVSEEKVREVINTISLFKTSTESMIEFEPNIDKDIFKHCYEIYEGYKKEKYLLDFDDLQIKCKELFLKNSKILNGYRKLFKYILVDEFQDCDSIQIDMLKLLNENNSIFAVGDEDQCIYGFRGAKPECMVDFDKNFKEGKKIYLRMNYRNPSNIVHLSSNLIKNNKLRNDKEIEPHKQKTTKINILNNFDENMQAEKISLTIQKLKSVSGYKYNNNAILYRTNIESRSLIDEFIRKKIPFRLLDKKYNFFEHFICRDIIAYLKLSIDASDKESFLKIINKPFRYISKVNIEKIRNNVIKEDCFEKLKSLENIPVFMIKNIDRLQKDINYLNKISLQSAIGYILMNIGYHDYLKEYSKKFKIQISELEDIVEEFKESCTEYNNIIPFLVHVEEVKKSINNNKKDNDDCIILSTIHGVKGMEFKNIFIVNCNEGIIPHENSLENNIEEERRLFYVAITRTIDNIWFSYSNTVKGKAKKLSRFIRECNLDFEENTYGLKKGDIVVHKTFGKGEIIEIGSSHLSIMFDNNIKRKFDISISLNNGLLKVED
ncbi:ATP-dependent helicase [Haloimpatiens sp. FM7330]|uniref:ATP-dependent helicase n=1 Tax=Haloimpatiens sp. FM7330 TaxID=3298610 RepID=UPI0036390F05